MRKERLKERYATHNWHTLRCKQVQKVWTHHNSAKTQNHTEWPKWHLTKTREGGKGENEKGGGERINHKQITYIQINPKDDYVPNNGDHKENKSNIILIYKRN